MNYRAIELTDKSDVEAILAPLGRNDSQIGFANIFALQKKYASQMCIEDGIFYLRQGKRDPKRMAYFPPLGEKATPADALELLVRAKEEGEPAMLVSLSPEEAEAIASIDCGHTVHTEADPAYFDYLYNSQEIAEYSSSDLGRKRRAARKFRKEYEGRFEMVALDKAKCPDVWDYQVKWLAENEGRYTAENPLRPEHEKIALSLELFDELELEGLIAYIDGKIAGYAYGTPLPGGAFDLIVLKSDLEHQGLWGVILQEMALSVVDRCPLLNLEEDLGIEGLRENKMRYHPCALIEKHTAWLED